MDPKVYLRINEIFSKIIHSDSLTNEYNAFFTACITEKT